MLPLTLSDRQKSIVAAAVTMVSLVVMVGIVFWFFRLSLQFFSYFSGVFMPLAVAGILATLIRPYYNWLLARLKKPSLSVAVVLLTVLTPLVLVLVYFGSLILGALSDFLNTLPVWIDQAQAYITSRLPALSALIQEHDLRNRLQEFLHTRSDLLTQSAAAIGQGVWSTGAAVFNSVAGLLGWLIMPVYFVFLIMAPVRDGKDIGSYLPFLKEETRKDVVYLVSEFVSILVAFFRGQILVAFCQGVLFAVGFAIAGLPHGVILGLLLGFLNIVPYLGNIIGLAVVLPLAWFHPEGGMNLLVGVLLVFTAVQCIEGYFLTPRIMGKSTGLHPMAIIFAILFWGTALSGLLGMILAIPLTAFLVVLWRLMKAKYITEWL